MVCYHPNYKVKCIWNNRWWLSDLFVDLLSLTSSDWKKRVSTTYKSIPGWSRWNVSHVPPRTRPSHFSSECWKAGRGLGMMLMSPTSRYSSTYTYLDQGIPESHNRRIRFRRFQLINQHKPLLTGPLFPELAASRWEKWRYTLISDSEYWERQVQGKRTHGWFQMYKSDIPSLMSYLCMWGGSSKSHVLLNFSW